MYPAVAVAQTEPAAPAEQTQPAPASEAPVAPSAAAPAPAAAAVTLPAVSVEGQQASPYKAEKASSPKYTEPLRDTPQSITVVPRAVIEERGATTLRDVMRNVSGISLVAGEGGGAQGDNFRIRGFGANNDMFIDGIRDVSQYSRDPFNLESVEVAKGPSSAYAGRGSTGGSINLVSKTARLEDFRSVGVTVGTDETRRLTTDLNQVVHEGSGTAVRLNAMFHDADIAGRDVTEDRRWGVAPTVTWGLGTATRVTGSYFHLEQDNIPDYGLPATSGQMVDVDHSNWYGFRKLNTEEVRTQIGTVQLDHAFSDKLSLRSALRYATNDRYAIVTPPRITASSTCAVTATTVCRNPSLRDTDGDLLVNQTDLTLAFKTGVVEHKLVSGVELSKDTYDQRAYGTATPTAPLADRANPDPDTPYDPTFPLTTVTENSATTVAVYAFDTLKLGKHWEFVGGLRHDSFDAESDATTVATGARTKLDRDDDMTSYRAATVFKPVEKGSIYLAYGTSFNPSAEALTLATSATATNNAALPPEKNRSLELGTKWDLLDDRLSLTAAVFRTEKTNARTRDALNPSDVIDVVGELVVKGFEVGVGGDLMKNWHLFGGYTYLDGTVTESDTADEVDNEIGNTPPHTVNLWTTYATPWKLELGAGGQYVSARTVSSGVQKHLQDYALFDAMIGYPVSKNIDVRLNVYNLTDEFYTDRVSGSGAHMVPGAGRYALLSTSFQF